MGFTFSAAKSKEAWLGIFQSYVYVGAFLAAKKVLTGGRWLLQVVGRVTVDTLDGSEIRRENQ